MPRRSLADRLAEYDAADFDTSAFDNAAGDAELERGAMRMMTETTDHLPGTPLPTQTHEQVAGLMVRILEMGSTVNRAGEPHVALGTALRIMRRMEGEARESLASVPEDDLRRWLGALAGEINGAIGHVCPHCGKGANEPVDDGPRQPLAP